MQKYFNRNELRTMGLQNNKQLGLIDAVLSNSGRKKEQISKDIFNH